MRFKETVTTIAALTIVGLLAFVWLSPPGTKQAPDISMTTTESREIRLAELRGRPVLVTFWATTCASCVKEIPHLIELYRELNDQGLEIIGVAMYYDPPIQVVEMIKRREIPYPVVTDVQKKVLRAFELERAITPTTFLIAPDGRIVLQKTGLLDMKRLRARIRKMLDAAPSA